VIGHYFSSAIGRHLGLPFLVCVREPLLEILLSLLEVRTVGRIHLGQLQGDPFRNTTAIVRVQPIMRVAQRMNVPLCTSDCALGDFQNFRELRCVQISGCGRLDVSVAALRDQRRQPANFQIQSHQDQKIGVPQLQQETRLGIDEMRVLIALGQRLDIYLVPSDLLRQRCKIGKSGYDLQILGRCLGRSEHSDRQKNGQRNRKDFRRQ
jgi:hypothetical protein